MLPLKHALLFVTLLFTLPGCATFGKKSKVDFRCVLQDERLGTPFTDPETAKAWLKDTKAHLVSFKTQIAQGNWVPTEEDLRVLSDLADLVERAESCLRK